MKPKHWRTSYPNEVRGIENGKTYNDIKVRTFSITAYDHMITDNHDLTHPNL